MEDDGVPGEEQPEEVKKKKRVCTLHIHYLHINVNHVLYNL